MVRLRRTEGPGAGGALGGRLLGPVAVQLPVAALGAPSSSSCVPCSTIRPSSSTTIRPAWRIVDSRWAMTIAVRPASSRRRPCSIRVSVCMSTFEVASSRTRIARVGDQRAGERDELALAGGELDAALADLGVVAVLERAR